jgi:hypothetical protein
MAINCMIAANIIQIVVYRLTVITFKCGKHKRVSCSP